MSRPSTTRSTATSSTTGRGWRSSSASSCATDGDEPGWRLAQELARRLGRARCAFVTYPQGCKDLNEALEKYGVRGVAACFSRASPSR